MTVVSAHKTDRGRERKRNEDYIWVDETTGVYIVADGMGGQEAGEVASELAATTAGQFVAAGLKAEAKAQPPEIIKELMIQAIEVANKKVFAAAQQAQQKRRMGAAVIMAVIQPSGAYISHAGDARAYLIHNSTLSRLTTDDSWGVQMMQAGLISEKQVPHNLYNHILTKAVGMEAEVQPAFTQVTLEPGDWLLLCSDGLWNMIDDEQILTHFKQNGHDPTQLIESLIEAANTAGGKDNVSVIIIKLLARE